MPQMKMGWCRIAAGAAARGEAREEAKVLSSVHR
jgi:hypothetical protein